MVERVLVDLGMEMEIGSVDGSTGEPGRDFRVESKGLEVEEEEVPESVPVVGGSKECCLLSYEITCVVSFGVKIRPSDVEFPNGEKTCMNIP